MLYYRCPHCQSILLPHNTLLARIINTHKCGVTCVKFTFPCKAAKNISKISIILTNYFSSNVGKKIFRIIKVKTIEIGRETNCS